MNVLTRCGQPFCNNLARWELCVHPVSGCRSEDDASGLLSIYSCAVCRRDWESDLIDLMYARPSLPVICPCGHLLGDHDDIIIRAEPIAMAL